MRQRKAVDAPARRDELASTDDGGMIRLQSDFLFQRREGLRGKELAADLVAREPVALPNRDGQAVPAGFKRGRRACGSASDNQQVFYFGARYAFHKISPHRNGLRRMVSKSMNPASRTSASSSGRV